MLGVHCLKGLLETKRKTKGLENGESEAPRACSAEELPTIKELRSQIAFLKPFSFIFRGSQGMREVEALEGELASRISVIDGFYSLLGDRGWVFSDALSVERVQLIVGKNNDPCVAEKDLISYLKEGKAIDIALGKLNRYEDMRPRLPLLRKASEDYLEGRYCSAVFVLIAVMDGFVNDFDKTVRRGLYARSPEERHTEDCVATMWAGLPSVQRTFVKSFHAREDAVVYSVFRHGIMHGMVTNFDNEVVASKAWCMLFGVCDWADSVVLDKKREHERREKEPLRVILKRHWKYPGKGAGTLAFGLFAWTTTGPLAVTGSLAIGGLYTGQMIRFVTNAIECELTFWGKRGSVKPDNTAAREKGSSVC